MAAVTKNLGFAITTSTSYEAPYTVAKRFSTLDHLTRGRFGWNIVTSFKESGSKALGTKPVDHDKRYEIADEYLRILYKLWEGSWADDALKEDREGGGLRRPDPHQNSESPRPVFHGGSTPYSGPKSTTHSLLIPSGDVTGWNAVRSYTQ